MIVTKSHQQTCRSGPSSVARSGKWRQAVFNPPTYQRENSPHKSALLFFLPLTCQIWSEVWRLPQPCSPLWCRPCCRWASKPGWWKVWSRPNTCWRADSTPQCPTWSVTSCRRSRRTEQGRHRVEVAANGGGYDLSIHVLLTAACFVTREGNLGKVWVGLGRWWSYSGCSGPFVCSLQIQRWGRAPALREWEHTWPPEKVRGQRPYEMIAHLSFSLGEHQPISPLPPQWMSPAQRSCWGSCRRRGRVRCAWTSWCPSSSSPAVTWWCVATAPPACVTAPSAGPSSGAASGPSCPEAGDKHYCNKTLYTGAWVVSHIFQGSKF